MTIEEARIIRITSTRCTQATLLGFGITGYPFQGSGCLEYLKNNRFVTTPVRFDRPIVTMEFFRRRLIDLGADYLIFTKGHAMSVIQGILIDTDTNKWDGRKIEHAWIVKRAECVKE